ncbi:hypothetical protein ONZ43_g2316 [Nemania bipapillata]|uniref:Uncharacterized protein n=1 Tax=Nemania bipapillata TaxID=110536 RepID=A0ACC2J109_9PEZI|nr:hypothetical protein ONZ43_g2316 [Nemania bipapillata]
MLWTPEPGTQTILTALVIIFLILNYIGVSLRCFVRIRINNSFSYDDWAMLASLAGYSGMCGTLLAAQIYGFGATAQQPWYDPIKAAQTLPIVMLWNVQLSPRVKLSVIILLGFSFTSSIATLVRLKYVVDLGSLGSTDPGLPLRLLDSIIWSHLEIALAIFAASLAALRPLLKFISSRGDTTDKNSGWSESRPKGRMTPAIRLDDLKDNQFDDGGSQEYILHTGQDQAKTGHESQNGIYKTTRVEVSHHAV